MKRLMRRYSRSWVFLYWLIYLPWFGWLEQNVTTGYNVIQSEWDSLIPFCELFVVPYLLWFPFVALTIGWFFFHDKSDFYKLTAHLYLGMTIFLVISTIFPNGLALRPSVLPRDNIFTELVRMIWAVDTPTNVFPSLHVYNSISCCMAVLCSRELRQKTWVRVGTLGMTAAIVLSTMFLKQHSVVDVACAMTLAWVMYELIYQTEPRPKRQLAHENI